MADSSCRVPVPVADVRTKASLIKHLPFERESGLSPGAPAAAHNILSTSSTPRPVVTAATTPAQAENNISNNAEVAATEEKHRQ